MFDTCIGDKNEARGKEVYMQKKVLKLTIPNQLGPVIKFYSNGIVLIEVSYLFGFAVFVLSSQCKQCVGL
jgi:hypothetical protein